MKALMLVYTHASRPHYAGSPSGSLNAAQTLAARGPARPAQRAGPNQACQSVPALNISATAPRTRRQVHTSPLSPQSSQARVPTTPAHGRAAHAPATPTPQPAAAAYCRAHAAARSTLFSRMR